MPTYFLAKTDPETYSIDDLQHDGKTVWDGVHNYQAINVIKTWKPGDLIFIYHSLGEAAIVGLAEVIGNPHPDANDKRGISWCAEIQYLQTYPPQQRVTLAQVKQSGQFNDFALVRQSRLSTMECPITFVNWVLDKIG